MSYHRIGDQARQLAYITRKRLRRQQGVELARRARRLFADFTGCPYQEVIDEKGNIFPPLASGGMRIRCERSR